MRIPIPFDHNRWIARIADGGAAHVCTAIHKPDRLHVVAHLPGKKLRGMLAALTGARDRIPDLVFRHGEETVVVEVGLLGPLEEGKWPELPMVHVAVGGAVEVVSPRPSPLADHVAEAARAVLA